VADTAWIDLLRASAFGALGVKALDISVTALRHRFERRRSLAEVADEHLDPLLKAADELVGKVRSLAVRDFASLRGAAFDPDEPEIHSLELASLLYLFARFFARIEILRREGRYLALARDPRGEHLLRLIESLEAERVCVTERMTQRAIGEALVLETERGLVCRPFIDFVSAYEEQTTFRRWFAPLGETLSRTQNTSERQRVLVYTVVVHALIDTLDPRHVVTREKPSYPNKLTKRSRRELRYRIFGAYAPFVPNPAKYLDV
jgi:hypothetical protein